MSISPIGSSSPITRLHGSKALEDVQGLQDADTRETDTVEISDSARYLNEIRKLPDMREEKVRAAREAIAAGRFETAERIDGTVDRLLEELR
jgi:flagellar biosynthesis anti-sigma factor FlgM